MFKTINPVAKIKARRAQKRYDDMIQASVEKLAETTLVPGYTNVYA